MKKTLLALSCFITVLANSQIFTFESAQKVAHDNNVISTVKDASGNVYTTGELNNNINISKSDSSGKVIWIKNIGGPGGGYGKESGTSIALDASGNVYVAGNFVKVMDFDPGAGTFNLGSIDPQAYRSNAFVLKLDASGNFVWAKQFGGDGITYGKSLTVDVSGNVYITGMFSYTADFDPGEGTFNLTVEEESDTYIVKLNAAGNFVWAKNVEHSGVSDQSHSIAVDASGNVYTTGFFFQKRDFDPGKGKSYLNSVGSRDIFISKLDAAGNFVWAKSIGGKFEDEGKSIALDKTGNVYVTGYFSSAVDFDPGKAKLVLTTLEYYSPDEKKDIFIIKLDPAGNLMKAIQIGDDFSDEGHDISVDEADNIYLEGYYKGKTDFDPGQGEFLLSQTLNGFGEDYFRLKLSQK